MTTWLDSPTAKLGDIGERIIAKRMHDKGWQGWRSIEGEEPHPFDHIWFKRHTFEPKVVEVKTHVKRRMYNDNGFDVKNYIIYQRVDVKVPVEILWIDRDKGEIYGGMLRDLMKPYIDKASGIEYPWQHYNQIYFCMDNMVLFDKLTENEIIELNSKINV